MGSTVESVPLRAQGLRSSSLKRPMTLQTRGCRMSVDPDGSVASFLSLSEGRALFGREQPRLFKVQAGVVVQAQRADWSVRLTPRTVQLAARVFEALEVSQTLEFHRGQSFGYVRRVRLRNGGITPVRVRVLDFMDPTAAHSGSGSALWGSLGMNAFNRDSHVAMDEVSDPPSARVVGATPPPSRYYMTTDRSRARDVFETGELPESTAGMSGQVMILSAHELDLAPSEGRELTFASIYNSGKLEDALSDFGRIQATEKLPLPPKPTIAASDQTVTDAAAWAVSAVESGAYSRDLLDRLEVIDATAYLDPALARAAVAEAKLQLRKDGSLPHSLDASAPGSLETSILLQAASLLASLPQDKKAAKAAYPLVKKVASYLMNSSKDFTLTTDPRLPQGWRRHLGRGYPTGEIPEISLAAAEALAAASQVARLASKGDDAAKFRERAEMITEQVRKRLIDERGFIAICKDSSGRLRGDETVDMAVSAYRRQFMTSAEQSSAHRLLEKDFDTPYGPRCVPRSNQVYFNGSYGSGQLGAVWPRAALAHSIVCYRAGLSGIGSLSLAKVARLVIDDGLRLGLSPGEFPEWVDVDRGEAHGEGSDPVAAARFVEALVEGELGLSAVSERASLTPAQSSSLGWVSASGLWLGDPTSLFVGRSGGKAHLFFSGQKVESRSGYRFEKCEVIELPNRGVSCLSFHGPGQVICLGNSTQSQTRVAVSFSPRGADLTKHLSTPLEVYDPAKSVWNKSATLRVSPTMSFEATVEANDWKAFRVSSA